jgi:outer membrane protein
MGSLTGYGTEAFGRTLTAAQARALALEFNRTYLAAKEDVRSAGADVTKAKSGALPEITASAYYDRNFQIPSFFVSSTNDQGVTETMEFKTGFKNSFGGNLAITQSIWQGGKVFTAYSIAKDYAKYANEVSSQVERYVVFRADSSFYSVALHLAQLEVLRKSHEAAVQNLTSVEQRFSQGAASEFEVLRASVEKLNLEPQILQAESTLKLAKKSLKSFLGLDLKEDVEIVEEPVESHLAPLPSLEELTMVALAARPEMAQANLVTEMSRKAVRIARGDYFPELRAVAAYDWQAQSDRMTLDQNTSSSWTAGLRLSVPIFRGGATRGAVTQAIVENNKAQLVKKQTEDDIRLQVEAALDGLLQAAEALKIQTTTIAQAEEGVRIADLRYESGVGTLLEVLSARAALTQAREIMAQATFAFRVAKAGLKLATTLDLDN